MNIIRFYRPPMQRLDGGGSGVTMNDQRRVQKSCAWVIAYTRDRDSIAPYGTMCVVPPSAPMEGGSRKIHHQSMLKPANSLGSRKTHYQSMFKPADSLGSGKTHFLSMFKPADSLGSRKTHYQSMFKPADSLGLRKTHFLSMFQNPETAAQNKFVGAHAIRWSAHKNSMLINVSQCFTISKRCRALPIVGAPTPTCNLQPATTAFNFQPSTPLG